MSQLERLAAESAEYHAMKRSMDPELPALLGYIEGELIKNPRCSRIYLKGRRETVARRNAATILSKMTGWELNTIYTWTGGEGDEASFVLQIKE